MKIYALNSALATNKTSKNKNLSAQNTQRNTGVAAAKNPTFRSYYSSFSRALKQEVTRFDDACNIFLELFGAAKQIPGAKTTACADFFSKSLSVRSVYALMMALSNYEIHPQRPALKQFVESAFCKEVILIEDEQKRPLATYTTLGLGFIDTLKEKLNSQCPEIKFLNPSNPEEFIAFSIDKDKDFILNRMANTTYGRSISYYYHAGMKRDNRYEPFAHNEATYYNRDGSKSFWKNLIGV